MKSEVTRLPIPTGPPPPDPPPHLSTVMTAWWQEIHAVYVLGAHHREMLRRACEAWDLAESAREELDRDGPTIRDRFGQLKPHPAAQVWQVNVTLFKALIRELGLDKLAGESRPPRLY